VNGLEATCQIIAGLPEVKVVMLSMHADRRFVTEALRAGATAFLLKDCAFQELARAVRAVMAHQTFLCSTVARRMP
jgi:two-component system response regulator NreC